MSCSSLLIDGVWLEGNGACFSSFDPSTQRRLWEGRAADASQLKAAMQAAHLAQKSWALCSWEERSQTLLACSKCMKARSEEIAEAISSETGKPLWEAKTEVNSAIAKFAITIEAYRERCKESWHPVEGGYHRIRHQPLGVVAVLGPFNLPLHLPQGHIVPALLSGNAVLFKPSEKTAAIGQLIAQLWQEAGLPSGLLNLLQGGGELGSAIASQSDLQGLFFTGSYRVGSLLQQQSLPYPGRLLALEMGGNNPLVVWHLRNRRAAIAHIILSAFLTSGQRCSCARRLILPDDQFGTLLLEELIAATKKLKVGSWRHQPEPFMGPLIDTEAAHLLFLGYQTLIEKGGKELLGLKRVKGLASGVSPGLVEMTGLQSRDEELFGPLLQVIRVRSFAEAIERANETSYGLAAGLLCEEELLWKQFSQQIRAGVVNWNASLTGASSRAPFGGVGRSGNFRPSGYYAIDYCSYPVASIEGEEIALPPLPAALRDSLTGIQDG